ncbi:TIM barrel protein [Methanospirillum stamsii]|uniref:Xylose isomerase-like TIM barrel domain-containing protein n=1 Tax=Methanospirillum stamsii TaxID=1277351 RepID=A0A2V2NB60_9EURY|nr:TIM barrel protein [Methanospirillum stamsii]PWR75835.1 hypothetical protein DLD82_01850 [Methanospirillum stamsii]
MKEIINISGYSVDLSRYNDSWEDVRTFVQNMGCSGVELLMGGEHDDTIPRFLISSVHLPGWLGWVRLWREPETVPVGCDPLKKSYYFGAATPGDLVRTFCDNLTKAARLGAAYAVFHITHIELDEFFTRNHRYTRWEVLSSAASFLNTACKSFHGGEPPVPIGFENLWWPGLTFLSQEEVDYFVDRLEFDNWIFVLDTGHLMNALDVNNEVEGIQKVLSALNRLSDKTLERIQSVHLQCSISGQYQKEHFFCRPPQGFTDLDYGDQISLLMPMISELDQHLPFKNPECIQILEKIRPDYVVHEFTSRSREELEKKIMTQRKALKKI